MHIDFVPVVLVLDDKARLVYRDGRLLAVITLQSLEGARDLVHVEAYFEGDAPATFASLENMESWIRRESTSCLVGAPVEKSGNDASTRFVSGPTVAEGLPTRS